MCKFTYPNIRNPNFPYLFHYNICISNFLGALNFLGEEASALSIKEATRGGSGWPEPTLGRSFGRIRRRALHQDLVRSLARSLAEIEIPRDSNVLASLSLSISLSRARAPIHRNTSCVFSFRVAASSPLIPPLREMVTGNSADDGGEGLSWGAEIYSDDIYKPNWRE